MQTEFTMNKREIETILKINGFDQSASDDQVRAVLLSARYTQEEVSEAISALRDTKSSAKEKLGLHRVFYSDTHLQPSEISGLLGVDISVDAPISRHSSRSTVSIVQFVLIWFFSVVFAVSGILFYMYLNQIGLFHPTSTILVL